MYIYIKYKKQATKKINCFMVMASLLKHDRYMAIMPCRCDSWDYQCNEPVHI